MLRIFLLSLIISAVMAAPLLNMVHKIHFIKNGSRPYYSSTSTMISCTTCKKALQDLIFSDSISTFSSRITDACHSATAYKSERIGCIQTLYQHRNVLFANQQRFIPSEASCHRIKAANCRPMIIMCDQRKKKGYCHVID
jgi:hypothetical protein